MRSAYQPASSTQLSFGSSGLCIWPYARIFAWDSAPAIYIAVPNQGRSARGLLRRRRGSLATAGVILSSQLAPAPVWHWRGEAAVTGLLHRDPRLAAHVTHVATRDSVVACHRAVQLAAVVGRDALASGDALSWRQLASGIWRTQAGR